MKSNRILAAVAACVMVLAAVFIGLQGKPVSRDDSLYITDAASVISSGAEIQFAALQRELAPRLTVAVVKTTGKMSTAQYCKTLWNNWRLGTSDMLLLMVTGKQDYYFGYDMSSSFANTLDSNFDMLMEHYLEPDFAAGDYENALFAFSDGIQTVLKNGYFDNGKSSSDYYYGEYSESTGFSGLGLLIVIAFVVLFIAVVAASNIGKKRVTTTRTVYHTPTPPRPRTTTHTTIHTPSRPVASPRTTVHTSRPIVRTTTRPSSNRPSGFSGGGRSSGGFSGGGRSSGFSGGGRSGGMGGRGRR